MISLKVVLGGPGVLISTTVKFRVSSGVVTGTGGVVVGSGAGVVVGAELGICVVVIIRLVVGVGVVSGMMVIVVVNMTPVVVVVGIGVVVVVVVGGGVGSLIITLYKSFLRVSLHFINSFLRIVCKYTFSSAIPWIVYGAFSSRTLTKWYSQFVAVSFTGKKSYQLQKCSKAKFTPNVNPFKCGCCRASDNCS